MPPARCLLLVWDHAQVHPVLFDHRLQVRLDLPDLLKDVDEFAIIQTVPVHVVKVLFSRERVDHAVIAPAHEPHKSGIRIAGSLPDDTLMPLLPFFDKLRQHFRRILEIAEHHEHSVARGIKEGIENIAVKAEIARVENSPAAFVLTADILNLSPSIVCRIVVDIDQLIIVP